MGIFDSIKKGFSNAVNSIKNSWNLNEKYNPYFNKREKFSTLSKIEESIDSDITKIYYQIKAYNPAKYASAISRYDNFLPKVREHNKKIDYINNGMKGFNFRSFIDNPLIRSYSELNPFIPIVDEINKFSYKDDYYNNFCNQVLEIRNNFDYIKQQYLLLDLYKDVFNFNLDYYFDILEKEKILKKLEPIYQSIKKTGKRYYDFSKLDKVDDLINDHNLSYIERHKKDPLFDNIRNNSLDSEQRESILKDEKASLIIAGAGSGKTLTICGKVKYLLEREKANPEDILLLSYSKKSAEDLSKKVKEIDARLTVGTFHKLGLDILKETQNKMFVVEDQYNAIIESYFRDEMKNRPQMLEKVLNYFALYLASTKHTKKYETPGEMYEDLKKYDYRTLKTLLDLSLNPDKKETIKKEIVKSFEEMAIANFYFINGVNYIYEKPYEVDVSTADKRQYTPDFFIKDYKIYHEHYGIDRDGKASQYEGEEAQKYVDGISWKRNIHSQNNTICIETYSYEFEDGTIFKKLRQELIKHGVKFKPLSQDEIYEALLSIYKGQNFKSFINLIKSFLSLYKARYTNSSQFDVFKNLTFDNGYERERAVLFLDIVKDVYEYYIQSIRENDKIDFDDMILQSLNSLQMTDKFSYKYIIVDEFQDISYSRMIFLKKLIEKGNARLFAVGDDWQAIYRFSGCDLNIFLNFSDFFGFSSTSFITSTHRNSQELQDIAGPFIKKNPEQYNKTIKSKKHLDKPVKIMYYDDNKYVGLYGILKSIYSINKDASVLILGRNNKDIEDFYSTKFYRDKFNKVENGDVIICKDYPTLKLKYSTVHSSKGLEDEFVVIINADDTRLGFPNKVEDDELLNLVLSSKSAFEFAEERRLWYVALTRTKSYTYILANKDNPSIFVEEIKEKCEVMNPEVVETETGIVTCPHCKSGKLVVRSSELNGRKFYGCSNYPFCGYTINDFRAVDRNKRCPVCGDFLIYRKGPYGSFFGCHGYPRCKYKEEYHK